MSSEIEWKESADLPVTERDHMLKCMKGSIGQVLLTVLISFLLIGGADFFILLGTDLNKVPFIIWPVELIALVLIVAPGIQAVAKKSKIKKGKFKWMEGKVTLVSYPVNTGHQRILRGVRVNETLRCDPPEQLGNFQEGDDVIVVDDGSGNDKLVFTKGK